MTVSISEKLTLVGTAELRGETRSEGYSDGYSEGRSEGWRWR